jgi:hypothetical protein
VIVRRLDLGVLSGVALILVAGGQRGCCALAGTRSGGALGRRRIVAVPGLGSEHGVDVTPALARLMDDDLRSRLDTARGLA